LLISDGILGFFFVILIELMVFGSCGTQMWKILRGFENFKEWKNNLKNLKV
jgi:hypothetical protein